MEPSKKSNTITIKMNNAHRPIDGEQNQAENNQVVSTAETFKKKKSDAGPQQFQTLTDTKEEDEFTWLLPEEPNKEYKIVNLDEKKAKKKKKAVLSWNGNIGQNQRKFPSFIGAVTLAVLLGTNLGIVMLNVVNSDPPENTETATAPPKNGTDEESQGKITGSAAVSLPALTSFVVQEGVYSNGNGAKERQNELNNQGIANAIITAKGESILLIGVADSLEQAKEIKLLSESAGVEAWQKQINTEAKDLTQLSAEDKRLMEQIHSLYPLLAKAAAAAQISSSIPEEVVNEVEKQGSFLNELDTNLFSDEKYQQIAANLAGAVNKITDFPQNNQEQSISEIQQHLLTFLTFYYAL
ncbi:hypothetical protein J9303_01100 [Bacillaceae bacterium Marseille-Q3522]|nr:hypothetical protein [Bacillaceae bacterium Marseille-Q3522]